MSDSTADLLAAGVPTDQANEMVAPFREGSRFRELDPPHPDLTLRGGEVLPIDDWRIEVVATPGHTAGHVCLWFPDRGILMSGDHVLPRITSNVSFNAGGPADPLGDYLASIDRVAALNPTEIFPAHEYRFRDAQRRFAQIRQHHEHRLAEVREQMSGGSGRTAWELAEHLTWSRSWADTPVWMRRAALSETLAHLVRLEVMGQVHREPAVPERWNTTT